MFRTNLINLAKINYIRISMVLHNGMEAFSHPETFMNLCG